MAVSTSAKTDTTKGERVLDQSVLERFVLRLVSHLFVFSVFFDLIQLMLKREQVGLLRHTNIRTERRDVSVHRLALRRQIVANRVDFALEHLSHVLLLQVVLESVVEDLLVDRRTQRSELALRHKRRLRRFK